MEIETLFTATRWKILETLSQNPISPIELSAKLNTSLANISTQLRLLEAKGLVVSKKIQGPDLRQPRINYSLSADYAYIVIFSGGFSEKKLIKINKTQKNMLRSLK